MGSGDDGAGRAQKTQPRSFFSVGPLAKRPGGDQGPPDPAFSTLDGTSQSTFA